MEIKKSDDLLQVVYGEVMTAGLIDGQQDYLASVQEIYHTAHNFLKSGYQENVDIMHNGELVDGAVVVESWVTGENDPVFLPNAWVVGIYLPKDIYDLYKKGELDGFSPHGYGTSTSTDLELQIPYVVELETLESEGHTHKATVYLNENGKPESGITDAGEDGHVHIIKNHTSTENAGNPKHNHQYDIMSAIYETLNVK